MITIKRYGAKDSAAEMDPGSILAILDFGIWGLSPLQLRRVMQRHNCSSRLRAYASTRTAACKLNPSMPAHNNVDASNDRTPSLATASDAVALLLSVFGIRGDGRALMPINWPTSGKPRVKA